MNTKVKKRLSIVIKIIISVVLIVLLLFKSNLSEIASQLATLSIPKILILVGLNFIALWFSAIKWKVLLRNQKTGYLFKIISISNLYTLILPGQLFGEASKVFQMAKSKEGVEKIASSVIIDKITGLLGLLIVGLAGILFTSSALPTGLTISLVVGSGIVLLALFSMRIPIFLKLIECFFAFLAKHFIKGQKVFQKISGIFVAWNLYSKQRKTMLLSVFWGIIYQFLIVLITWLTCIFLNVNISMLDQFWINAVLAVALLLPISFGGIGLRDATLVVLLGMLGVQSEMALSVSMILLGLRVLYAFLGVIFIFGDLYTAKKTGLSKHMRE